MRICLVSPLTIYHFGDPELTLEYSDIEKRCPLGVLCLAGVLIEQGQTCQIVFLDQLFLDFVTQTNRQDENDFAAFTVRYLASLTFDVLGFGTICSSYPLTLRLAEGIKKIYPDTPVILGGPQASIVDEPTMINFPSIDFIVRQEADDTLPALLSILENENVEVLKTLKGVTFRLRGDVIRNPDAPVITDMDHLPLPAFHLLPGMEHRKSVSLEIGRGCPFGCAFCSTSKFFGRRFRLKSPERIIEHMRSVKERYGIGLFSFTHDMFTANRESVLRFCKVLLANEDTFQWGCSARVDCIDDELIALMAKAGCAGIFFGIETGSERLQRSIRKNLNLSEAAERIKCAGQNKISTAVAFIIGFPDETKQDLRQTIHFYVDSLRFDYAEPQLSLLAPLSGTRIHTQYKDRLIFDYIFSDMSYQGWRMDTDDLEMIKAFPQVFPNFYGIPTSELDRSYFQEIERFITYTTTWLRWLMVLLLHDSGDLLKIFDRWKIWWKVKYPQGKVSNEMEVPYYHLKQFPKDFLEFVQDCYVKEFAKSPSVISAFIESEGILKIPGPKRQRRNIEEREDLASDAYPYQRTGLLLTQFNLDYQELVRCLRNKQSLEKVPLRRVTVCFQRIHRELIKVRQLSQLSAELWKMCSGTDAVRDVVRRFSNVEVNFDGIPPEVACYYGLNLLKAQGLIGISSRPVEDT